MAYEVAEDIKKAYIEVGVKYNVFRENLIGSGEYLFYEENRQVTKPFIRESFLEASIPYDTSGESGDILKFDDGRNYILMSKTPSLIENEIIEFGVTLYKANVSGELSRPSGEAWDSQTYHKVPVFEIMKTNCFSLLTESLFRYEMVEKEIGNLLVSKDELYVPKYYGIQINDRYSPRSGEFYKVSTIKTRGFVGVDVVEVEEDTR